MSWRKRRMVIVSNRLPVVIEQTEGGLRLESSCGGLVTAIRPLLNDCEGVWVGWTGADSSPEVMRLLGEHSSEGMFQLRPVFMSEEERSRFYCGFSNEIVWPLFHDLQSRCNFDPTYWDAYLTVSRRFAEITAREAQSGDLVWVHDYHLMSVAAGLRQLGVSEDLAYFHHIPFPSPDIFEKLPWRREILTAMLDFDTIGFQTLRDRRNFVACLRHFVNSAVIESWGEHLVVSEHGHRTVLGAFPVGILFDEFAEGASTAAVARRTAEIVQSLNGCRLVLGVDRLDYTKGIPERLSAYHYFLEAHPEARGNITLVQVVVPSREDIPRYFELKSQLQQSVSEINGRFSEPGWVPVHYLHRSLDRQELLAYYRAADVALITPLKDGMNLVAKEYCAARINNDGVLILSEFAGAAFQLHSAAILVNPYHTRAVAEALATACRMSAAEQRTRMQDLRERICREDIVRWRDSFCSFREVALEHSGEQLKWRSDLWHALRATSY